MFFNEIQLIFVKKYPTQLDATKNCSGLVLGGSEPMSKVPKRGKSIFQACFELGSSLAQPGLT